MSMLEMRDRVLTLSTLEKRMKLMIQEIQEAESEVSDFLRKYERESRDVERFQSDSFSAFLFRLVGKYEDKLEKEQREEINAKIDYNRAVIHLDSLKREKDDLAQRISELRAEESKYRAELDNRRRDLSSKLSEPDGILFNQIDNERDAIIAQITEIEEALRAASRAKSTANKIAKSLDSAEGWATFDAFTRGGIISHMAKYSHIDEAEKDFNTLSHNLRELKVELGDVEGLSVSGLTEISLGQRIADFWFDNIFTDLSVRSQIKDNAEKVQILIKNITATEFSLNSKRAERETELAENRQREEELLLSMR